MGEILGKLEALLGDVDSPKLPIWHDLVIRLTAGLVGVHLEYIQYTYMVEKLGLKLTKVETDTKIMARKLNEPRNCSLKSGAIWYSEITKMHGKEIS